MIKTERIERLQESLRGANISGVVLFNSRDVFYYTGTAQPSCLFVSPQDYLLFVRAGIDFARKEVTLPQGKIREERSLEKVLQGVSARLEKTGTIGTELDLIPARNFLELRRILRGFKITDISPMVLEQRGTKDLSEIAAVKRACAIIHKGHERVLTVLRKGITELELAAAVEDAHRLGGHEGLFFIRQPDFFMGRGPLASGQNLYQNSGLVYTISGTGLSASVPAGPSRKEIKKGDLVVVDIPVHVEGYHADQTRTYVLGKPTEEVGALFSSLKEIADHLIGSIRAGMRCSDIYQIALSLAEKLGVGKQFMNFGQGQKSKIIGHGVGIELNEPPILSASESLEISENCVIALDMHLMDEKHGVVKLEDMVLIGERKNDLLTITPRELFEIE